LPPGEAGGGGRVKSLHGLPLEYIVWRDHHSLYDGNWTPVQDIAEQDWVLRIHTVGWVIRETQDVLVVVTHIYGEGHQSRSHFACGDMTIDKRSIESRRPVLALGKEQIKGRKR